MEAISWAVAHHTLPVAVRPSLDSLFVSGSKPSGTGPPCQSDIWHFRPGPAWPFMGRLANTVRLTKRTVNEIYTQP